MIDTAFERHGVVEARLLAAGDDPIALLSALLRDSGARVTFDLGASCRNPCTTCGAPGPHELVRIGTYPNGEPIARPVCERHRLGLHLRGCEPDDRELQVLAAYERARGGGHRAPTKERLREELGRLVWIAAGARP